MSNLSPRYGLSMLLLATAFSSAPLAGGSTVSVATGEGTVVVDSRDGDVEIAVKQNGKVIEIVDTATGSTLMVSGGKFLPELKGDNKLTTVSPSESRLLRGDKPIVRIVHKAKASAPGEKAVAATSLKAQQLIGWYEAEGGRKLTVLPQGRDLVCVIQWGNNAPPSMGKIDIAKDGSVVFRQPRDKVTLGAQQHPETGDIAELKVLDTVFTRRVGVTDIAGTYKSDKGQIATVSSKQGELWCDIDWANGAPHSAGWIRVAPSGQTILEGSGWQEDVTLVQDEEKLRAIGLVNVEFEKQ